MARELGSIVSWYCVTATPSTVAVPTSAALDHRRLHEVEVPGRTGHAHHGDRTFPRAERSLDEAGKAWESDSRRASFDSGVNPLSA